VPRGTRRGQARLHLPRARGAERLLVDAAQLAAQRWRVAAQLPLHVRPRPGRHLVLQRAEGQHVRHRQQVGTVGEHLTHLDVAAGELLHQPKRTRSARLVVRVQPRRPVVGAQAAGASVQEQQCVGEQDRRGTQPEAHASPYPRHRCRCASTYGQRPRDQHRTLTAIVSVITLRSHEPRRPQAAAATTAAAARQHGWLDRCNGPLPGGCWPLRSEVHPGRVGASASIATARGWRTAGLSVWGVPTGFDALVVCNNR
jgi:hypothetical protein